MKRALLVGRVLLGVAPVVTLTACCGTRRRSCRPRGLARDGSALTVPRAVAARPPGPALGLRVGPGGRRRPGGGSAAAGARSRATPEDVAACPAQVAEATQIAANRRVLVDEALGKARAALANADVDGARAWYGKAIEIDPTNVDANQGWKNLSADRASDVSDYTARSRREEVIKSRRGHRPRSPPTSSPVTRTRPRSDCIGEAVKEYQAALAIVSWYADQSAFGATSESLRDLIKNGRLKADRARRENLATAASAAQKRRELDLARRAPGAPRPHPRLLPGGRPRLPPRRVRGRPRVRQRRSSRTRRTAARRASST